MTLPDGLSRWYRGLPIFREQILLFLVTLLLIRGVVELNNAGVHEVVLALVPVLFMWMPYWACIARDVDPDRYPIGVPLFSNREAWTTALKYSGVIILVVFPLFIPAYHYWQTLVFGHEFEGTLPKQWFMLIGYHLFFVAIPEEIFYRGYMQSRFDELWPPRWDVFGAKVGPGLLVTCVLFAFGHSLVQVQWWHFAIIFPSLVFGWLRIKTGDVMAGAFFHAWCNITVAFLDTAYGIIPP